MSKSRSKNNMLLRAKMVQDIVAEHYEPGRQDKCKLWVFRNVVSKVYPMSERTFFRYLSVDPTGKKKEVEGDPRQLKLF